MRRVIAAVVTAGLFTLGTVGVAAAQQGGGSTSPSSQPASSGSTKPAGKHHRPVAIGVLRVTAKTLGVKPRDLISGLCSGKTLAQLAGEHGKTSQDVVDALVKAADQRIDRAVQKGRLTSTQAAQDKTKVQAKASSLVSSFKPSAQRCQRLQQGSTTPSTTT
jgi:hypothetical protein